MRTRGYSTGLYTNPLCSLLRWPWLFAIKLRGRVGELGGLEYVKLHGQRSRPEPRWQL
jgi:hypothetical protein